MGTASTVLDTPTMRRKREQQKQPQDPKLLKLKAVSSELNTLSFRFTTLERPIVAVLQDVKNHARDMNDPELVSKAEAKLQRLFGSLTSAVAIAQQHLAPLIKLVSSKISDTSPTIEDLREILVAVKQHLPAIQNSLRTLDPKGHHTSLVQEIEKQKKFLLQLESFSKQEGSNQQAQAKIKLVIEGAQSYLIGLEKMIDPEFEDRITHTVSSALDRDIPTLVKALKSLGDEFRSGQKTASSVRLRKRIQRVAKRIVLLSYLRSRS